MSRGFNTTFGIANTDIINTGYSTTLTLRTWSLWLWISATTGDTRIVARNDAGGNSIDWLGFDSAAVFTYSRVGTSNGGWTIPTPSIQRWHHIAVVYDESANGNDALIYVDGVVPVVTRLGGCTTPTNDASTWKIGNGLFADNGAFPGILSDAALFNRLLRPGEVRALAQAQIRPPELKGLVVYVPLEGRLVNQVNLGTALTVTGTRPQLEPPQLITRARQLQQATRSRIETGQLYEMWGWHPAVQAAQQTVIRM